MSNLNRDFGDDGSHRYGVWQLISLYLDSLQEAFERSSNFSSSQHILIGKDFEHL